MSPFILDRSKIDNFCLSSALCDCVSLPLPWSHALFALLPLFYMLSPVHDDQSSGKFDCLTLNIEN